jgi:MFS family permease
VAPPPDGRGGLAALRRGLSAVAIDLSPLRVSRDYRRLVAGQVISALGTSAVLVALPFQIYVVSRSAPLVGLLGAFELVPIAVVSLLGGAFLDRRDRRPILVLAQLLVMVTAASLGALSLADGHPPAVLILLLGGLLAGGGALDQVARNSIYPRLLGPEHLRPGLALGYGIYQVIGIAGPSLGGLLIVALGVGGTYVADAASCLGLLAVAVSMSPQPPPPIEGEHPPVLRAIGDGLAYVRRQPALAASFIVDINAMLFGMPRALFAVLALTVYHAGAGGTGLMYSAIAVGGTLAVVSSGWVERVRRVGRLVIGAVVVWGLAIVGVGLVRSLPLAMAFLVLAGWADSISAVGRQTISQLLTPEVMRGRMSSVYLLVVTGGPRLGDIESGLVAGLTGALASVWIGGVACVAGAGLVALAFPQLAAFDGSAVTPHTVDPQPPAAAPSGDVPGRDGVAVGRGRSG